MADGKGILVIGEMAGDEPTSTTLEALAAGRSLRASLPGEKLSVILAGASTSAAAQIVISHGAEVAYTIDDPSLNDPAPENAERPDPDEMVSVPGSSLSMRRGDISLSNGPPDWHPDGHPSMPEVVASGGNEGVVACAYCHLPNGQGKPENAGLAGQPFDYIVQQMEDYRNGLRKTGEPRMGPPSFMMRIEWSTFESTVGG